MVNRSPSGASTPALGSLSGRFDVGYGFPVYFTRDAFSLGNTTLPTAIPVAKDGRSHKVVVFVDSNVQKASPDLTERILSFMTHHAERFDLLAPPIPVHGGEVCKTEYKIHLDVVETLIDLKLDRHAYVVAIGGGAVLDCVGYATAIFHRGVNLVRLPTTTLAQNDAGIGVKNGINYAGIKNCLGTFAPPVAVINDDAFLATLSERDLRAGLAEAVKVALIRDGRFFDWLEDRWTALAGGVTDALTETIYRCAQLHLYQIAGGGDPFETGSARPLDYGHWLAHRLEVLSGHELRHGEAVAIGMVVDADYARRLGYLSEADYHRIEHLLLNLGFNLWHPALEDVGDGYAPLLLGLEQFREHLGGELSVTLLRAVGRGEEVHRIDVEDMRASLRSMKRFDASTDALGARNAS